MRFRRIANAVVLGAIAFGAVFLLTTTLWHHGKDGPLTNAIDFRAFYCAGSALDAGSDPYLVEPVRACERTSLALAGFSFAEKDVLVAPYPPVLLVPFAVLARLPYRIAVELWMTIGILSLCAAIVATAKLTTIRPAYVALALVASVGFASFFYGQPMPLVVAGFVLAALAARSKNGALVVAALVVASLQPHLALAAWLGAFAIVPASRKPIAICAALLALVSFALFARWSFEYATVVLPLHARSEVGNFTDQYGLTALLRHAGMSIPWALRLGSFSYFTMLAVGLALAARLARVSGDAAFAVVTPVAIVTIGGPFLHGHQIAAAIPFALLLFARVDSPAGRPLLAALGLAIVALAIPWQVVADEPGVNDLFPRQAYVRPSPFRVPDASEQIDRSYTEREDALSNTNERTPAVQLAWKLPTWFALLVVLGVATTVAVPRSTSLLRYGAPESA